jgi:hypothetical protein
MSDKKRWQPPVTPGDEEQEARSADRAQAAARAMSRADTAMKQADAALAAAGLRGEANYSLAAAAMRDTERLERKALDRAQAEVEQAMARAGGTQRRASRAEEDAE